MTARIVVLCALALLAGCTPGDRTKFAEDGISFRYPDDWHVSGFSTTSSPPRIALASYAIPDDAVEGDCGGSRAVELLPRDGALVVLIEYRSAASFAPRATDVELEDGEYAEFECLGASTMFRFRVGDRDFQANVALGRDADERMRERALAILESIEVEEPEPFVPETRREGDRLVMPLTFPDGTTAELAYPAELGLEAIHDPPVQLGDARGRGGPRLRDGERERARRSCSAERGRRGGASLRIRGCRRSAGRVLGRAPCGHERELPRLPARALGGARLRLLALEKTLHPKLAGTCGASRTRCGSRQTAIGASSAR